MTYGCQGRKIFYHVLRGSRLLFADERDKKILLDLICRMQKKKEWQIYGFCVMDDMAYLISEAEEECVLRREYESIAASFLGIDRSWLAGPWGTVPQVVVSPGKTVTSMEMLAAYCREIHLIPLRQGYVQSLADYWWSSFITYMGYYEWEMVECRTLERYFSTDPEIARRKLLQFHTEDNSAKKS